MKIADLFYSIQGEGLLLGVPSAFVRTTGCNLRCHYCDTPYTSWHPEGEELSVGDILRALEGFGARHVVLTGGEPLLLPEAEALTRALHQAGYHITVETAATVYRPVACDLMSISPKLSNSTPEGPFASQHERVRIQTTVLEELIARYDYQLKFVIETPTDVGEARDLVNALAADRGRVILMPEGTDPERLRERALWLAEICKEEGYRFSPRLHVDLYGNRRGV